MSSFTTPTRPSPGKRRRIEYTPRQGRDLTSISSSSSSWTVRNQLISSSSRNKLRRVANRGYHGVWRARYDGRCFLCNKKIDKGDPICGFEAGMRASETSKQHMKYAHERCADENEKESAKSVRGDVALISQRHTNAEQLSAISDWLKEVSSKHAIVEATAGAGKTTLLMNLYNVETSHTYDDSPANDKMVLCYNKRNKEELVNRGIANVWTFHSLAWKFCHNYHRHFLRNEKKPKVSRHEFRDAETNFIS